MDVNERAQHFLKVLIERYIRDGQPVGSRTLAKDAGIDLSPATIRNVMSDLEELGFINSPHTSAGRVPTSSGYRIFVDSLLTLKPLEQVELGQLQSQFSSHSDVKNLLESASSLLSNMTHMAGVVMVPRHTQVSYRQIEFVSLSSDRVLTILVTSEGEVLNKIIETQSNYQPSQLEQAANFLNQTYSGQPLEQIRSSLLSDLEKTREQMDSLMAEALQIANKVFDVSEANDDYVLAGQTNLMDFDELRNIENIRQLFDTFAEKSQILHLLDRSMSAEGVQIFIGEESGYEPLGQCSVVTAPYELDNRVAGVLGVIGPTRMAYDRVIPIVDVTAKLLGAALKHQ
ncbi:MAG: heat-inducible transcriptional repressor HrcA [Chromatiales bacterium]|jgi:heat-inducible transcriptional repressor